MANTIVNYDGSITASPQQLVYPGSVEDIQAVLRDPARYPAPVRAMGSYHSLTPCASSDGTVLNMSRMNRIVNIDETNKTVTAQAGLEYVDASKALRDRDLQFMLNIEIGNMTLGSAACCHTKDALDGIEFGQVSSYVTGVKWVTPAGELAEASETANPELLAKVRSSYGLCGVIYEVTFRIKPIEALHFTYLPRPVDELAQPEVDDLLDNSEGLICWTVGRTCIFQRRQRIADPSIVGALQAAARRRLWNFGAAHVGHFIDQFITDPDLRDALQQGSLDAANFLYGMLHLFGGISLLAPDKTIDYRDTPASARYAFTFWAFPRSQWLGTLRDYLDFAERHFQATGFRCNMPLGAYHIRRDTNSILSYTYDQEVFSIDPIHAVTDLAAWQNFLRAFNDFAYQRNGIPLLNQSPFVERTHVERAYGRRWLDFCDWVRTADPAGRMLNPFFADLLSEKAGSTTSGA
ncbi:MAG TPA: FAD-binding protein [Bryobacteraceae bacterium]|nr:FAD-binding protein [Bryobacteraceae bacterium]